MRLSRRRFLAGAASTPILGQISPALAELSLGTAKLTTLSDGHLILPGSFLFDAMPKDALPSLLADYGLSENSIEPECNLTLLQDGDRNILFDVGSGPDFMPTAGRILDSLDAVGLAPEDITHVVFTHAHPDHIWGLLDDFDDPLFYEAEYLMGRADWDYWWNPETVNEIGEARASFAVGAKRRMEAIEDAVTLFDADQEILPGVLSVASHGHTPGHMSFEVRDGTNGAMILGDAIGNHHVAFHHPDWPSGSDQDAETAIATRQRLFDRITTDQLALVGFHLPGGGIGRVDQTADGYRFVSEV